MKPKITSRNRGPACYAEPIDEGTLQDYRTAAKSLDPTSEVGYHFRALLSMVEKFFETGESSLEGIPIEGNREGAVHVPLETEEIDRIWDYVPWSKEIDAIEAAFDTLPNKSDIRKAAFHLSWYARELTADREPITKDKLPK